MAYALTAGRSNFLIVDAGTKIQIDVKCGFPRHLLPRVWSWIEPHKAKLLADADPHSLPEFMAAWDHPTILASAFELKVDGELGGVVRFTPPKRGVSEVIAFFPGYTFRQTVIQSGFVEALGKWFAANEECRKVEWRGMASQSGEFVGALRRAGGGKEAVIEHGALQDGRWVRTVQMGILREAVI